MGIREGRRERGKEQVRPVMMRTKSNKGRRGREREQSNSRRGKNRWSSCEQEKSTGALD